ncbi:glycosyltransferase family 87 protein [Streptomyces sp. NPDC046977]|uniref:glycosyltransferase family 87 protein n=1 Tax=Streptomyces sp. NPDC046977 TaxID=3154703 RepID=UPI0033F840AB
MAMEEAAVAEARTETSPHDWDTTEVRYGSGPTLPGDRRVLLRPSTWPQAWVALGAYWLSSRVVMLALLRAGHGDIAREVYHLYQHWSHGFERGTYPVRDVTWQYPPGAALVMLTPALLPGVSYLQGFVLLSLLGDALVLAALVRAGWNRPGRSITGAWMWVLGLPLLMHLPYSRYDLLVTAVAVCALLAVPARPRLGGALVGLAAMIKLWPALTVLGTPRGRTTRQAWTALGMSAAALLAVLTVFFRGATGFVDAQHHRGVEVESLGGTVLHVAGLLGWSGRVRAHYGSMEFIGPYVNWVATTSLVLTGGALVWLLVWRLRAVRWTPATPYDAAMTAVLLFTVTSRVISPQYLIWLIGLGAVCLTMRQTTQRPVTVLLLVATAVTTVDYPLFFEEVVSNSWQGTSVVAIRNALLVAATAVSCTRLWRASVPRRKKLTTLS